MTGESSRMSLLARAGQKGSASTSSIMDSAGVGGQRDTKGPHRMVLNLGASVPGIQESPDDPGDLPFHGKGFLSSHN